MVTIVVFLRAPLLPDMGRDLDLTATGLGALISFFALGRIVMDIPAGWLFDRYHSGLLLAGASAATAVGAALSGLAPAAALAYTGAFGLGVGSAWTNTTGLATFALVPKHRRGVSMSGFAAALMVGQALGPAFGGAVASVADWRAAFGVGAFIAAAAAVAYLLAFRGKEGPLSPSLGETDGAPAPIRPLVLAILYLLPAVQFGIAAGVIQTLVPIVGDGELGISIGEIGAAIGAGGILRLVGVIVSGRASDRYSRKWALVPGLLIQAGGVAALAFGSTAAWLVSIALISLGSSTVNVGATVLADLSEGSALGQRLGVFRVTGDVALLVAPLVTGAIYDAAGRAPSLVPLLAFSLAVTALAAFLLPETMRG